MFSSITSRRILQSSTKQTLVQSSKRHFQLQSKQYFTGFEKTILDKFKFFGFHGHWFAIWGVLNLIGYGLHFLLPKDAYKYHFHYTAEGSKMFSPLKAMMGSDNWSNIVWTAPTIIGLNFYLHSRLGSLRMTKLFIITLVSSYIFLSIFNPQTGLNFRPLHGWPGKFDANDNEGKYFMGADQIAQSLRCRFAN